MSKVIFITGASSGIGQAIASHLQAKGYTVYGTSRNAEKHPDKNFKMISLDLLDTHSIQQAVEKIIAQEGRIDVLINNAGIGLMGSVEEMPTQEIKKGFDINFFGQLDVIKTTLPYMRAQKSGLIINITSIGGYTGLPFRGAYSSAKSALHIITESLNMELKKFNINAVTIAPGSINTNISERRYYTPLADDSPYKDTYTKNLDLVNEHVNGGLEPLALAQKVEKIINTKKPKIHYKVAGFMEKLSIILKKTLPSKVYEKLLMNHYKL